MIYFGGIRANSQSYLEYNTDLKPGIFEHNEVVQNLLPQKAGVTLNEDDPNVINHAFKPFSTGNSYDSDADYIMIGDTFAIGYIQYKEGRAYYESSINIFTSWLCEWNKPFWIPFSS